MLMVPIYRQLMSQTSKSIFSRWKKKKPSTIEAQNSSAAVQEAPTGSLDTSVAQNPIERVDKHGLFLLNPPQTGLENAEIRDGYSLDIVAIHGITGDAFDTWTHENGTNWLRDFVPKSLPGARVFSFGYPAGVLWTQDAGDLDSFARSLLTDLKRERRKPTVRSLINL
jgi:hypothetical protein